MIAAVSFDGDQTLWDFDAVMRHALSIVLDRLRSLRPSVAADALTVDQMIAIREEVASELARDSSLVEIRRAAFERAVMRCGSPDSGLTDELTELYLHHRFADIELYPDVIPALDALAGRYRLGLLTNGNTDPERCGLPGRFDFVVFGEDHGTKKPEPGIFEVAARAARARPSELVHVGDSSDDIIGAKESGWRAVLLNRSGEPHRCSEAADFEISSLSELPALLDGLAK